MMTREEELAAIKREEIKIRAVEFGEAQRIIDTFDKYNDEIAGAVLHLKGVRTVAACSTKLAEKCTNPNCDSSFISSFNSLRRKARQIYQDNMRGFWNNGIKEEEILQYKPYEDE